MFPLYNVTNIYFFNFNVLKTRLLLLVLNFHLVKNFLSRRLCLILVLVWIFFFIFILSTLLQQFSYYLSFMIIFWWFIFTIRCFRNGMNLVKKRDDERVTREFCKPLGTFTTPFPTSCLLGVGPSSAVLSGGQCEDLIHASLLAKKVTFRHSIKSKNTYCFTTPYLFINKFLHSIRPKIRLICRNMFN